MGIGKYRYKDGFTLDTPLDIGGLKHYDMDTDSITKGQAVFNDGNGYATNAVTALSNAFLGIAAASVDNSAGSAGDLTIPVIPPDSKYSFWVKVEANALVTQAAVGTVIDLEQNDSVDISDTTIASGYGFKIDAIDVSTDAVAFNTYGMVKGYFESQ